MVDPRGDGAGGTRDGSGVVRLPAGRRRRSLGRRGAGRRGAVLRGAVLRGAAFRGAVFRGAVVSRFEGQHLSAAGSPVASRATLRRGTTRYGPGHRGVDLASVPGAAIRSAGPGVVTFAGSVAGRGVVVVHHPDGIRTTYEPVLPAVGPGDAVSAGQVVGRLAGQHAGCPASCLHWGARRDDVYLDPLGLLHPLGPIRLLAWAA